MFKKSNHRLFFEFFMSLLIVPGVLLCIFPEEGPFFRWWEAHTLLVMLGLLAIGLAFFFINFPRLTLLSFAGCAALCLLLDERTNAPLRHADSNTDQQLRIGQFSMSNAPHLDEVQLSAILSTASDLISIQNVRPEQITALTNFFTCCGYPYFECVVDSARQSALGVYSRYAFDFVRGINFPQAPGIVGKVQVPGRELHSFYFFNAHFYGDNTTDVYEQNRENLHVFAQELNRIRAPLLVFGDYQMVSWAKDIQSFRNTANLRDSRRGMTPTTPHGYVSLFDHPFDHIFYSDHFKCISFETISSAATLHLGIVGTYEFATQDKQNDVKQTAQEF
ncbi:MAG TPA: hypothetical protein PKC76_15590 [Saprospiraceae bacterium]|nr:hypothetical protein [Saprospiraceae bacterium]HMP25557.1 hypothetical protein [Saprospiraceae bacterium]